MANTHTTARTLIQPSPRLRSIPVPGLLRRLLSDCVYLLVGFPVGLVTFVLVVTGLALGAGLAMTLLGLPILAVTLHLAGVAARLERVRIAGVLGVHLRAPVYCDPPPDSGRIAQLWTVVSDPQRWSEAVHGLVGFPVATFTWSLAVTSWSLALAGLAYPVYVWGLPQGPLATGLAELIGLHGRVWDVGLNFTIGVSAALSLPWVMRGLAVAQASLGRALLAGPTAAPASWVGR